MVDAGLQLLDGLLNRVRPISAVFGQIDQYCPAVALRRTSGHPAPSFHTVKNTGESAIIIGEIGGLDSLLAPFSIVVDLCSNQLLSPGQRCSLIALFSPESAGVYEDSYAIAPHIPCGLVTPDLLRKIADVSEKYNAKAVKITGAARIAIIGLKEEDIDAVWEELGLAKGAAVGFRAGLFNIGVNGQMLIGGMAAVWVGLNITLPGYLHIPLALVAAVLGEAL